ncbi:MAG: TIGR03905 family TSCPD domain-containing protein [Ruminococcaceae bacterium]|nr:TIGR03905 family TSCPD domain-containing protein [Oscillospiraceae bacterium]
MEYRYKTRGVCASEISFEIEEGIIKNVSFRGGCNGNLKAISKLVEGKDAQSIAHILEGNTCGFKSTSCADQLSKAINKALAESLSPASN